MTKRRKDLFDAMRDGGRTMRQQPSNRAWRRLEDRLDHRRSSSLSIVRLLAMAASIAVLIGVVYSITWLGEQTSNQTAMAEVSTSYEVEDLTYTDVDFEAYQAVDLRKDYAESNYTAITEGTPNKRLVASKIVPSPSHGEAVLHHEQIAYTNDEIDGNYTTNNDYIANNDGVITIEEEEITAIDEAKNMEQASEEEIISDVAFFDEPAAKKKESAKDAVITAEADMPSEILSDDSNISANRAQKSRSTSTNSAEITTMPSAKRSSEHVSNELAWLSGKWFVKSKSTIVITWNNNSTSLKSSSSTAAMQLNFIKNANEWMAEFKEKPTDAIINCKVKQKGNGHLELTPISNSSFRKISIEPANAANYLFKIEYKNLSDTQKVFLEEEGFSIQGKNAYRYMNKR